MILKELADLAKREGLVEDPDFEPKPVRWIVHIGLDGQFFGMVDTRVEVDGKARPKVLQVPRAPVRTSGSAANFLVDKAEYALGYDPDENPRKVPKLALHRSLFAASVETALTLAPDDAGLKALLAFVRDDAAVSGAIGAVRGKAAANDLFAFRAMLGDESGMVHDREAVRSAWKAMRHPAVEAGADLPECLVCGGRAPAVAHPQVKRIPGGSTSGIAIVSSNASAFESYGQEGNEGAPICRECSDSYGTALSRLFHPQYTAPDGRTLPRRSFRLSDDTGVVYWASGAEEHQFENEIGELDFEDAGKAGALFEAVHSGKGVLLGDTTPFHALIVTGGQGRATLRSYFQSTVGEVAAHLREYFEDIEIVRRFPNSPRWPPLSWLVRSLAAQGKFENVAPALAGRLFLAILSGESFPAEVLSAAIARIRSEPEKPDQGKYKHTRERMALIRATINRWLKPHDQRAPDHRVASLIRKEIPPVLDETCSNNAYCLGRLFAVLEKLQGEAIGKVNASIADRFYGAASATPASVFGTLLRKAQSHLAKMSGPFYVQKIQEVMNLLSPPEPFPTTLTLAEQGLFALGYYQQRAELWTKKPSPQDDAAGSETNS